MGMGGIDNAHPRLSVSSTDVAKIGNPDALRTATARSRAGSGIQNLKNFGAQFDEFRKIQKIRTKFQ